MVVPSMQWIGGLAGLGALTLGLLFWIANNDFIGVLLLFGLAVTMVLLVLSILAVSAKGMRRLGAGGIAYALLVLIFGLTQDQILDTSAHWLIQTAQLLVDLDLVFIRIIATRYQHLKQDDQGAPQATSPHLGS